MKFVTGRRFRPNHRQRSGLSRPILALRISVILVVTVPVAALTIEKLSQNQIVVGVQAAPSLQEAHQLRWGGEAPHLNGWLSRSGEAVWTTRIGFENPVAARGHPIHGPKPYKFMGLRPCLARPFPGPPRAGFGREAGPNSTISGPTPQK